MKPACGPCLGLAAVLVLLGASRLAADEKAGKNCINRREINAISALDDRHAFAKLSAGRFQMLTVDRTCQGLKIARKVALSEGSGRVCDDGGSLLVFETPTTGPMRCRIEAIDAVADKNAALELIESRRQAE